MHRDIVLRHADCREAISEMLDNSIDSIVTDPPYELGFMGKGWDSTGIANDPALWAECLRVLKPGGHLAAFSASRTYHRMACAIEDAGFEMRDSLMWLYGTGFPKSMNVGKMIDKAAGSVREVIGEKRAGLARKARAGGDICGGAPSFEHLRRADITAPATAEAAEWEGWGTALKPAFEPIVLARKPLSEKTVAANVLRWRTGALNIDACRVSTIDNLGGGRLNGAKPLNEGWDRPWMHDETRRASDAAIMAEKVAKAESLGRWPANVVHDGSDEVIEAFPANAGGGDKRGRGNGKRPGGFGDVGADSGDGEPNAAVYSDSGSAARFFYSAKASKADRNGSKHPTVKPISLMRWLAKLITPPGGTILDPFAGSGTTGAAAIAEGFKCVLIERETEYAADIRRRFVVSIPLPPIPPITVKVK